VTLLSVVRDVCAVVGVTQPTAVVAGIAANRTMQEMLALANEMAQRIAYDTRDWTMLKTITLGSSPQGDGSTPAFNLPSNFKRMLLTTNVWRSTSYLYPMTFIPDLEEYMNRMNRNIHNPYGEWTLVSGQIFIQPTLQVGESASYTYLDKNCIKLASGGLGDSFTADNDSFRLDERLLKLGMIWQWKANKGTSYAEDMGTYSDALSIAMGHDSPAPIIIGRRPMSANVRIAYPFPVPT
jgi:hypothetical protein